MREIDFLPEWYPRIQNRYRAVVAQAWVTLVIVAMLGGYAIFKRWQLHGARLVTAQCQAQISLSQMQLAQLAEKLKYQAELKKQDEIVARLGLDVDATRLLRALQDAMTPEMALTDVSMETIEQARPVTVIPARNAPLPAQSEVDRRLKVTVNGVSPSDIQVATLIENLGKIGCFENVAFSNLQDRRSRDGHLMREFEVTFDLNLNPPAEGKP
jgi:Tfp pilus assembly protein PilN